MNVSASSRKSLMVRKSISPRSRASVAPKKLAVRVLLDGKDVTPLPLIHLPPETTRKIFSAAELNKDNKSSLPSGSAYRNESMSFFHTQLHHQTIEGENLFQHSYIPSQADDVIIAPEKKPSLRSVQTFSEDLEAPSVAMAGEPPTHLSITLAETNTFYLFEISSVTEEKDTPEGNAVEGDNKFYDYLTMGKGRNRKVVEAEAQTVPILRKTRATHSERVRHRHIDSFASIWDMHDTYEAANAPVKDPGVIWIESIYEKKPVSSWEKLPLAEEEKEMLKLNKNARFQEAVLFMERVLANNNFNEAQKRFRGLSDPSPFRRNIEYKYRLQLLWTFANNKTTGKCATAVRWHHYNKDILAVGYGKFYFTDVATGMVMIWNAKNPVQPERTYTFDEPVTALSFSLVNLNLLAVGFYDGSMRVLDFSSKELRVIAHSRREDCYEPIWQATWYAGDDYFKDEEQIFSCARDGRILIFKISDNINMNCMQMMKVARAEGKLKGIETMKRCTAPGISISRYPSVSMIRKVPEDDNIYYAGTSDGTIHKCSRNYHHQHLSVFLGHDGRANILKFSPFCSKIFLTAGDDWTTRVWADGVTEPLLELSNSMQSVQGADWSPIHSTVLVTISGTDICVWDLQRKTYQPQSITNSPTSARNTFVEFTTSGRCVVVSDIDGNVHVFSLEDMPFPAFFQADLFRQSLQRALITKKELWRKVEKLGNLNYVPAKTGKYFT